MILDNTSSEAACQLAADDGWPALLRVGIEGATLSGAVDISRAAFGSEGRDELLGLFQKGSLSHDICTQALELYSGRFGLVRSRDFIFSAPRVELWLVRSWDCLGDEFQLYVQRFERSLRQNGFGRKYPKVLAKAFSEMIENVMRHSSPTDNDSVVGVVGYHVINGSADLVVADLGQGVMSSLRTNPDWAGLADEQEALVAAARDGATRIKGDDKGYGFKMVFKSFLEREGLVSLRSGDGVAVLRGNMNKKVVTTYSCAMLRGFRVSISLSVSGKTAEIPL